MVSKPGALWKRKCKEDLMLTHKRIAQMVGLITAALLVFLAFPIQTSFAASSNQTVGAIGGWVNQIFEKVWAQVKETEKSKQKENRQQSPSKGNNQTNPKPNEKKDTNKKEEQSSVLLADQIIKTGEKYLGTPYQYGAPAGQTRTFDCSSFTQYVYKQYGISLPRSSRQQAQVGITVPRSQIQKGDLLFFKTSTSKGQIGHVAIYAGNNRVLHTWGPGGVRYDQLSTKWLDQGYITAKRVIK
jgi:cell wall-associated NlpC family hydrolase